MDDISYEEFKEIIEKNGNFVILAYTNMCGTCERAKNMLNVVGMTLQDVSFHQINVNLYPQLIKDFEITSIPCFFVIKDGTLLSQFYAFHSVTFLFQKFKELFQ